MRKYLVNSTYCIYLIEIGSLYFDNSVVTTNEVVKEVEYEKKTIISAEKVLTKKINLEFKNALLSGTDSNLLQTAKVMNYILVSDDQKLIKSAQKNKVHALDTPHFIHVLLIENKWSKEKALVTLSKLKTIYNRIYIIEKVEKDIENWG